MNVFMNTFQVLVPFQKTNSDLLLKIHYTWTPSMFLQPGGAAEVTEKSLTQGSSDSPFASECLSQST